VLTLRATQLGDSAHEALMKRFGPLQARLARADVAASLAVAVPGAQRRRGAAASGPALDRAVNEHGGAPRQPIRTRSAPPIGTRPVPRRTSPSGIILIFTLHLIKLRLGNSSVSTVVGSSKSANSGNTRFAGFMLPQPLRQGFERCSNLPNLKTRRERSVSFGQKKSSLKSALIAAS
jgi:hypothetical protein